MFSLRGGHFPMFTIKIHVASCLMNSPQQRVFSHPSSSPPITTLHPSPSQHRLAVSFPFPTTFVGPTGKRPLLFLSHHPLTTPKGGQQPCGAHSECFGNCSIYLDLVGEGQACGPVRNCCEGADG